MRSKRMNQGWALWLLLATVGGLWCSCGVSGGGDSSTSDQVDEAWRRYRLGQYESAAALFEELAQEDVEMAESYGGLGWSRLHMLNPAGARQAFQSSLVGDADWMDSRAGELFALRDAGASADVLLSRSRSVLQDAPAWRFQHEQSVDWQDVQVLAAQVFFYTQRFDSCLAHCLAVDNSILLSREDTLSWQNAPSFEAALLREVERLGTIVTE